MIDFRNSIKTNSRYWITFLLLFLVTFCCIFIIHPFYEEGSTQSRIFLLSGVFFEPITDWPVNQIFIADFYANLYKLSLAIPWFNIVEMFLILILLALVYEQLIRFKNILILIIFFIVSIDNTLYMSYTRTASLLLTLGPTLMFLRLINIEKKISRNDIIYCGIILLLCIIGFMNKPFSAYYAIGLNFLFFIAYYYIETDKRKTIFKSSLSILVGIAIVYTIIFSVYYFKSSKDHRLAISYSADLYNLNSANSFKQDITSADSVGILLLEKNFISDRNYYNNDFVKRVARNQNKKLIDFSKFFDPLNINRVFTKYIPQILTHHKIELVLIIIIFLVTIFSKENLYSFKLPVLFFLSGSLFILAAIIFLIKSELRVSSPILLYTVLGGLILYQKKINFHIENKFLLLIFISFLVISGYDKLSTTKTISKSFNQNFAVNQQILNELADEFDASQTVIFNLPSYSIVKGRPFKNLVNNGNYKIQTYDVEAMTYMESFKNRLIIYCGSIDIVDFYQKAYEEKETTFFLSNDSWNDLISAFVKLNYNREIIFEKRKANISLDSKLEQKDLYIYQLKEFTQIR